MRVIYRAKDPMQAHLLAGMLQSEGIEAEVTNELLFGMRGEAQMDSSTLPSIEIPDHADAVKALRLIEDYIGGADTEVPVEPWVCAACSESIDATFTQCWNCGADMPAR